MSSVSSPEEVCNMALDRIGYPEVIGDIFEGTRAARAALRLYSQTRDEVLSSFPWAFARRDLALTLLKTAPPGGYGFTPWTNAYPFPPWIYEYAYPADCIQIRAIRRTPWIIPSFDPVTSLYTTGNDNAFTPPQKVILTNVASALLVYTGQVVDLTTWDQATVEALVEALGRRFTSALSADPNLFKENAAEEQKSLSLAAQVQG